MRKKVRTPVANPVGVAAVVIEGEGVGLVEATAVSVTDMPSADGRVLSQEEFAGAEDARERELMEELESLREAKLLREKAAAKGSPVVTDFMAGGREAAEVMKSGAGPGGGDESGDDDDADGNEDEVATLTMLESVVENLTANAAASHDVLAGKAEARYAESEARQDKFEGKVQASQDEVRANQDQLMGLLKALQPRGVAAQIGLLESRTTKTRESKATASGAGSGARAKGGKRGSGRRGKDGNDGSKREDRRTKALELYDDDDSDQDEEEYEQRGDEDGYGDHHDLGNKRNEAGCHQLLKERQRKATILGMAALGNVDFVLDIFKETEKSQHKMSYQMRMQLYLNDKEEDQYTMSGTKGLRIWDHSTTYKGSEGKDAWNGFIAHLGKAFEEGALRLSVPEGNGMAWIDDQAARPSSGIKSLAASSYQSTYFYVMRINEFVQKHFEHATVNSDPNAVRDVLAYIRATIWADLKLAAKDTKFCKYVTIYRATQLLERFEDAGMVVQKQMQKYNLYGRVAAYNCDAMLSGSCTVTGTLDEHNGGALSAVAPINLSLNLQGLTTNTEGTSGVEVAATQAFGNAAPLKQYRSHKLDLNGKEYRNKQGLVAHYPVCDLCEYRHQFAPLKTYMHNPWRCDECFPDWKKSPPELVAGNRFYIRGKGKPLDPKTWTGTLVMSSK